MLARGWPLTCCTGCTTRGQAIPLYTAQGAAKPSNSEFGSRETYKKVEIPKGPESGFAPPGGSAQHEHGASRPPGSTPVESSSNASHYKSARAQDVTPKVFTSLQPDSYPDGPLHHAALPGVRLVQRIRYGADKSVATGGGQGVLASMTLVTLSLLRIPSREQL